MQVITISVDYLGCILDCMPRSIEFRALHVSYCLYLVIFVLGYAMSCSGFSGKDAASDIRRPLLHNVSQMSASPLVAIFVLTNHSIDRWGSALFYGW